MPLELWLFPKAPVGSTTELRFDVSLLPVGSDEATPWPSSPRSDERAPAIAASPAERWLRGPCLSVPRLGRPMVLGRPSAQTRDRWRAAAAANPSSPEASAQGAPPETAPPETAPPETAPPETAASEIAASEAAGAKAAGAEASGAGPAADALRLRLRLGLVAEPPAGGPIAAAEDALGSISLLSEYADATAEGWEALDLHLASITPCAEGLCFSLAGSPAAGSPAGAFSSGLTTALFERALLGAGAADWLARARGFRVGAVAIQWGADPAWRLLTRALVWP